jgi:hypothetical protein
VKIIKMEKKITDINDLVVFLAGTAMEPLLNDEIWRNYGYKKRPRKGNIWNRIFPKKFELENLITKEILTMSLIDILNGIRKAMKSSDIKLLLSIGVIDQFLSATKHLFDPHSFMKNLFSTYTSFSTCEKSQLHVPFILKAKKILNEKDFAKFLVGTTALLGTPPYADDFLVKSDYIKESIDNSSTENRLKICMPEEMYKEFGLILSEKILNT